MKPHARPSLLRTLRQVGPHHDRRHACSESPDVAPGRDLTHSGSDNTSVPLRRRQKNARTAELASLGAQPCVTRRKPAWLWESTPPIVNRSRPSSCSLRSDRSDHQRARPPSPSPSLARSASSSNCCCLHPHAGGQTTQSRPGDGRQPRRADAPSALESLSVPS